MNVTDQVLGVRDAAVVLRKSRATVKRYAALGLLASTKLPGPRGQYLFDRADVEAFAAERGR